MLTIIEGDAGEGWVWWEGEGGVCDHKESGGAGQGREEGWWARWGWRRGTRVVVWEGPRECGAWRAWGAWGAWGTWGTWGTW